MYILHHCTHILACKGGLISSTASLAGGLSIAVPGEVSGFMKAHELFGRVEWHLLFEESINLAENGFPIGSALASAIRDYEDDILNDPNLR